MRSSSSATTYQTGLSVEAKAPPTGGIPFSSAAAETVTVRRSVLCQSPSKSRGNWNVSGAKVSAASPWYLV